VETTLLRLQYFGEVIRDITTRFAYARDPRDEKFIELAIAGRATHVVSFDKDLLSLPEDHSDAGKRFRQRLHGIVVIEPGEFIRRHGGKIGIE
jgi:predicted nucleic acid-binding protein